MIIKSYDFELMNSKMYILREGDAAVVIDPSVSEDAFEFLSGATKVTVMLTHEHYDHISGVNEFKDRFNCEVICSSVCHEIMSTKSSNTRVFPFLFLKDREKFHYVRENIKLPYFCSATSTFDGTFQLSAANHSFKFYEMPGHSPGSSFILMDDNILFAGDNILGNGNEIIFRDSDKAFYQNTVVPFLENLDGSIQVMPGHGEPGSLSHFLDIIKKYEY